MKVIVDASPLISLAVIDQLKLLVVLFPEVIIPQAVYQEIKTAIDKKESFKIETFIKKWVRHAEQENISQVNLGMGELEAIELCRELRADLLVIDDKKARKAAESLGIKCIGTLGLLTLAKKRGLITELRKYLIRLTKGDGIFLTIC